MAETTENSPEVEAVKNQIVDMLAEKGKFTPEETKAVLALNDQQRLFAKYVPKCRTATEAAIRAGYTKKNARYQGSSLNKNLGVQVLVRVYTESADVTPDDFLDINGDPKDILARGVPKVLLKLWGTIMDPVAKPREVIAACKEWLYMSGYKPTEKFEDVSRHPDLEKLTNVELMARAEDLLPDVRSKMIIVPKAKKEAG